MISLSDISAVNLIVGWYLLACSINPFISSMPMFHRENTSLLAGGYWGFHRGKPVPFANRAPSWIFEARAPGYERASAKMEGGGRGREEKNRLLENQLPLSSSLRTQTYFRLSLVPPK